ncbi:hypothetical protein VTO42DRAFT_7856 [Malbranchea cinnamomea]
MPASKEPAGPPVAHPAEKKANTAPHVPSKLSNSFTPGDNNNGSSTTNTPKKTPQKGAEQKPDKPAEGEKLSGAELKKRAKAEKAARRAKERQEREQAAGQQSSPAMQNEMARKEKKPGRIPVAPLPVPESKKKKEPVNEKVYGVFSHLSSHLLKGSIKSAGKDVHPAILTLGLQIRSYALCGSAVRCTAMLLAFKQVLRSYKTPEGTSLARHLTSHLGHQIDFITTCRPLSISQGNAIRALKLAISKIDPTLSEETAKARLFEFIDTFIEEKISVADQAIAYSASQKIRDGDVILTYAGSNIVRRTLLCAKAQKKKFRVIVIDTRPIFEGGCQAGCLVDHDIEVEYVLISGITAAMKNATKVFLGAHSMMSNGYLYSRAGTSLVAMAAKDHSNGLNIPVIICCETVKFSDRTLVDSIVVNELANPDELVVDNKDWNIPPVTQTGKYPLENWKATSNLKLLHLMHDVTPAKYIDMVITEMGALPPSAVPTVHRIGLESAEN